MNQSNIPSSSNPLFKCHVCNIFFKHKKSLVRHKKTSHTDKDGKEKTNFECIECRMKFLRKIQLKKHLNLKCKYCRENFSNISNKKRHEDTCDIKIQNIVDELNEISIYCHSCDIYIKKRYLNNHYLSFRHRNAISTSFKDNIDVYTSALKGNVMSYRINYDKFITIKQEIDSDKEEDDNEYENIIEISDDEQKDIETIVITDSDDEREEKRRNEEENAKAGIFIDEENRISFDSDHETNEIIIDEAKHLNLNIKIFFQRAKREIVSLLRKELENLHNFKFRLSHIGIYYRQTEEEVDESTMMDAIKCFSSDFFVVGKGMNINKLYQFAMDDVIEKCDNFTESNSGWTIFKILQIQIDVIKIHQIYGGSFIALSKNLKAKNALLNIKNSDNKCLLYCLCARFFRHQVEDPEKSSSYYQFTHEFMLDNMDLPLNLRQIRRFEKINSLSINIYSYKGKNQFGVVKTCEKEIDGRHIDLLLLERNLRHHYVLITDFERLIKSSLTNNHSKIYICKVCLSNFTSKNVYEFHKAIKCNGFSYSFPKDDFVEFKFQHAFQKCPIRFYFDCEVLFKNCENFKLNDDTNAYSAYTRKINEHIPLSVAYNCITFNKDPRLDKIRLFRGRDCIEEFIENLIDDCKYFYDHYYSKKYEMSIITPEIQEILNKQTHCTMCNKLFEMNTSTAIDHCHYIPCINNDLNLDIYPSLIKNSNIRSKLCTNCNLQLKQIARFPVYSHNGSRYDYSLVLNFLLRSKYSDNIKVIPKTQQRYITFSFWFPHKDKKIKIIFLDTYAFLPSSLSAIVDSLHINDLKLSQKFLREKFPLSHFTKDRITKIPFFYKKITSFEICDKIQNLPKISDFTNDLTKEEISQEAYNFVCNLYEQLDVKTWGNLYDAYVSLDCVLLADCFESFVNTCIKKFKVSPQYFVSLPSFTYNCMILHSDTKIEYIKDSTLLNVCIASLRGGLVQGTEIINFANNKYLPNYNPKLPTTFIHAYDINGLYAYILHTYKFPDGNYEWIIDPDILDNLKNNILNLTKYDEYGYIFIGKVLYPKKIHEYHDDYPLLVEKLKFHNENHLKLCATLLDKELYSCHYMLLQNAVKNGLILDTLYVAIKFHQSFYLKNYVSKLIEWKENPKNSEFETKIAKLLSNSLYGRLCMNIHKRRSIKFITNWNNDDRRRRCGSKLFSNPNLKNFKIIDENLVLIETKLNKVKVDTLTISANVVLDGSKKHMSEQFYDLLVPIFGRKNIKNLGGDTDCIIFKTINIENPYEVILKHAEKFDCSSFNGLFGLPDINRKKSGLLACEAGGRLIKSFCYVRSKCYAMEFYDIRNKKETLKSRVKGIPHRNQQNFTFADFLSVHQEHTKKVMATMQCFLREDFRIFTIEARKCAIRYGCMKRRFDVNGKSMAWGNINCKNEQPFIREKIIDLEELKKYINNLFTTQRSIELHSEDTDITS